MYKSYTLHTTYTHLCIVFNVLLDEYVGALKMYTADHNVYFTYL